MTALRDLTGMRFGRLTVQKRGENKNGKTAWLCKCDCGNEKTVLSTDLTRGLVKSCGCFQREFRVQDITGNRYGMLTVISMEMTNGGHGSLWKCRCDCGNELLVRADALKTGHTRSCGCYNFSGMPRVRHGMTNTRLHRVWNAMKQRCGNPNNSAYKNYGARGINVCDEWNGLHGFDSFAEWALKNGYAEELEIDRIDNNKGYSPDNCRFVSHRENMNNTRANRYVEIDGVRMSLAEAAEKYGLKPDTVRSRIAKGWDLLDAVTRPYGSPKRGTKCASV